MRYNGTARVKKRQNAIKVKCLEERFHNIDFLKKASTGEQLEIEKRSKKEQLLDIHFLSQWFGFIKTVKFVFSTKWL